MKKPEEDLAQSIGGVLGAALVIGLILVLVLPMGYIIRVLVRTGSPRLLAMAVITLVLGLLVLASHAAVLMWLAAMAALATLVLAKLEEERIVPRSSSGGGPTLPFGEYRW